MCIGFWPVSARVLYRAEFFPSATAFGIDTTDAIQSTKFGHRKCPARVRYVRPNLVIATNYWRRWYATRWLPVDGHSGVQESYVVFFSSSFSPTLMCFQFLIVFRCSRADKFVRFFNRWIMQSAVLARAVTITKLWLEDRRRITHCANNANLYVNYLMRIPFY